MSVASGGCAEGSSDGSDATTARRSSPDRLCQTSSEGARGLRRSTTKRAACTPPVYHGGTDRPAQREADAWAASATACRRITLAGARELRRGMLSKARSLLASVCMETRYWMLLFATCLVGCGTSAYCRSGPKHGKQCYDEEGPTRSSDGRDEEKEPKVVEPDYARP